MKTLGKFQSGKDGLPVFMPFKYGEKYCSLYLDSKYDKYWRIDWATIEDIIHWNLNDHKPTEKDYHAILLTIFESIHPYDWTPPLRHG